MEKFKIYIRDYIVRDRVLAKEFCHDFLKCKVEDIDPDKIVWRKYLKIQCAWEMFRDKLDHPEVKLIHEKLGMYGLGYQPEIRSLSEIVQMLQENGIRYRCYYPALNQTHCMDLYLPNQKIMIVCEDTKTPEAMAALRATEEANSNIMICFRLAMDNMDAIIQEVLDHVTEINGNMMIDMTYAKTKMPHFLIDLVQSKMSDEWPIEIGRLSVFLGFKWKKVKSWLTDFLDPQRDYIIMEDNIDVTKYEETINKKRCTYYVTQRGAKKLGMLSGMFKEHMNEYLDLEERCQRIIDHVEMKKSLHQDQGVFRLTV